jgi:chromosomal replication initiation ATPase DnaA
MKTIEIDQAIQWVTGFTKEQLKQKTRVREIKEARQIAMSFYMLNGFTSRYAGLSFNKSHCMALHAKKTLTALYEMKHEEQLRKTIDEICTLTGLKWIN